MATARAGSAVPAFVLHHYDWSETSLIVDLFTRPYGRLAVVAKGAKRPYSQLRSVLLPFQRLSVNVGIRKDASQAEVQILRTAEWAGGQPMLAGNALLTGFYVNELVMKGLPRQDPHPRLFDSYARTIDALPQADDAGTQAALRAFELTLLQEMGLLPELSVVTTTQLPLEAGRRYVLRAEVGVSPEGGEHEGISAETLMALEAALGAGDLDATAQACRAALGPLKTQLRALLHYHLGTSGLRTRQVMLDAQRLID